MTLAIYLDDFGGSDEVDGIGIVFFHTCTNGEDVGVKDDVIGVKSHFADQQIVGSSADFHFTVSICGLEESKLVNPGVCVLEICAESRNWLRQQN